MNWYSQSKIRSQAAILPDYGISDSIWTQISWMVEKMSRLAGADRLVELAKLNWKTGGPIWREADDSIPEDLLEILRDGEYKWQAKFLNDVHLYAYQAAYSPQERTITLRFNTSLPMVLQRGLSRDFWKEQKTQYMRDLFKVPTSIRHETMHLMRDAQTGHLKRYVERMKSDKSIFESYHSGGHGELEFEIDAKIASLELLRRRLGEDRYDKLTPARIEEMLPGFTFPEGGPQLAKWVKRLMREGLLTSGMRRTWNL